jgi:hypothetical protein
VQHCLVEFALAQLLVTLSPSVICASPVALAERRAVILLRKVREVREGIGFIPFPHFVHFPAVPFRFTTKILTLRHCYFCYRLLCISADVIG